MNKHNTLVVVGAQWGDEGKGKITDYFSQTTNLVVRFSGGDNAGHQIHFNGKKHKVRITPSGIFNKNVVNIIGNGCVVNLEQLIEEIELVKKTSPEIGTLLVSNRAQIVLPYHMQIDAAQEEERGEQKIGTTKRGIGPAYQDKVSRSGIRIGDLADPDFKAKFLKIYTHQQKLLKAMYNIEINDFEKTHSNLIKCYDYIKDYVVDCGEYIESAIKEGKKYFLKVPKGQC
nr:adenylosuccinate synthetase [Spiroplasma clarkii]